MTGKRLDDAYDNVGHIPDAESYLPRWRENARAFRAVLGPRAALDLSYGRHAREAIDLFLPERAANGLVVFVHGGYWLRNDKSLWSHLAAGPLARGWAVAMPSYILAPEARVSSITRQIAAAIGTASARVPGPVRLAGHSAGGHLVTRMLCADMAAGLSSADRITRVVSISGLHDLRPLLDTTMNDGLRLDRAEAASESPALLGRHLSVPVTAWVGGAERPAFLEQSRLLADAWPNVETVVDPGRHHFDVIDALADPDSPLVEALLR